MFRIGSLLYIPAYISVILYRVFASASDDGNLILMAGEYNRLLSGTAARAYQSRSARYQHVSVILV